MRCPYCQSPIDSTDTFCGECGRPLDQAPAPSHASTPLPMPGPPPQQPPSGYGAPPSSGYDAPPPPAHSAPAPPPPSFGAPAPPPPAQVGSYGPPKKKNRGCLIVAVILVLVLGCGAVVAAIAFGADIIEDILGDPTPVPYDNNNSTTTTVPSNPPTTGTQAVLDIENNLDVSICYVYISLSTADAWGDDWLGDSDVIEPGDIASFWVESGQTVDIQVQDCDYSVLDEQYEVYVYPEGITYTLDPIP